MKFIQKIFYQYNTNQQQYFKVYNTHNSITQPQTVSENNHKQIQRYKISKTVQICIYLQINVVKQRILMGSALTRDVTPGTFCV